MAKQNLTPTAKRMKAARDKRAAMTADRRKKKAENQRKRRAAKKAGKNIKGKDGSIIIVDVLALIPPQQKELSETKGKVISDYQDFLEKQWLGQLKEKYQVIVNRQVLHSLIQ